MASLSDNYLLAEQPIIDRLLAEVPELRRVSGALDMDTVLASATKGSAETPVAVVAYDGDELGEQTQGAAVMRQRWAVVLIIRAGATESARMAQRGQAGELIAKTLKALLGYRPVAGSRPLALLQPPSPTYFQGGAMAVTIGFALQVPVIGS